MKTRWILVALLSLFPLRAFPWGAEGHQAIALAADAWLNEPASEQVHAILEDEKIEEAATWPDEIRGGKHPGKLFGSPEEKAFDAVPEHKHNDQWHFVDLPLGLVDYDHSKQFTTSTDVVQIIGKCIDVLEGRSTFMEKKDALRWLIHLVGDVHQPLHVGVGYFSFADDDSVTLHREPTEAALNKAGDDIGGNKLIKGSQVLHSYWDANIPHMLARDAASLAEVIKANLGKVTDTTTGKYTTWAPQWATESAKVSNDSVYDATLTFGKRIEPSAGDWDIYTSWPTTYGSSHKTVALKQLTLAAKRLADLLNAIKWPSP